MKHLIITAFIAGLLSSPANAGARYEQYEARNAVIDGHGGSHITKDDVDFWTLGDPPRRYEVIGIIRDDRRTGVLHGNAIGSPGIAKLVLEHGGNGVIVLDQNTSLRGFWSQGQATVTGNQAFGSGISIPLRERTTTFAVVRYLPEGQAASPRAAIVDQSGTPPSPSVEDRIAAIASRAKTPAPIGFGFTVTRVEALGQQLLFTASSDDARELTPEVRRGWQNQVCANGDFLKLLRAGASLRAVLSGSGGKQLGAVMVTAEDCGLS